jgi:hypothetical protein
VRGSNGGVAAQREVFVYADQYSLQVDDLRLQLDPGSVVSAGVWLSKLKVCAVVSGFYLRRCGTHELVFAVGLMLLSLVETPSDVVTD